MSFFQIFICSYKIIKTQIYKTIKSGGFRGRLLEALTKIGLPLIKNVIMQLAKTVLIPLGLTTAASAVNKSINKKMPVQGEQHQ